MPPRSNGVCFAGGGVVILKEQDQPSGAAAGECFFWMDGSRRRCADDLEGTVLRRGIDRRLGKDVDGDGER